MYRLPTKVTVDDLEFNIRERGDFRMVLDCFKALQDEELSEDYRVLASLLIFYNELNDFDDLRKFEPQLNGLVKEMYKFINGGETESPGAERDVALVDWEQDSQLVCAAINNVANQEIRSVEYLHWWTFLGYYMLCAMGKAGDVADALDIIKEYCKIENVWFTYCATNDKTAEDRKPNTAMLEYMLEMHSDNGYWFNTNNELKNKKMIERIGGTRGYWKVIK